MAIEDMLIPTSDDKKSELMDDEKSIDNKLLLGTNIQNSEKEMPDTPKKEKKGFYNWMKSIFKKNEVPIDVGDNNKVIANYDKTPTETPPGADRWTWKEYLGIALLVAMVIGYIVFAVYQPLLALEILLRLLGGR